MTLESSTISQRAIPADFYTPSYRIVGKVLVPNTGLMGLVNDQLTSFMEIVDARLARVHMPSKLVDHYEVVRIVKSQIFAIALTRREDIGPQALARGGYVRLNQYPVSIATPVYELHGLLEWAGRFDFSAVMIEGTRDFVPIYEANLTAVLIPALKVETPALLFNRRQVDLLALNNQRIED
ncbi:MAG: hypothetical protein DDG60_05035 [Anaerolineae bacterium]|nr:MAG: hypothetical protein DDG60_05035 [Anaerolineae bacterium]